MVVLGDRVEQRLAASSGGRTSFRRIGRVVWVEAMKALADHPAVVAALFDNVDLLEQVLSDVAEEQPSVLAIEREAIRVAEAVRIDLVLAGRADERVVRRDRVRRAAVHVDAQDRAKQREDVLAVADRPVRRRVVRQAVVRPAAVPQGDVQEPVGTESDAAAVVVELRLVHREQHRSVGVGDRGIAGHAILGQDLGVAAA